jgi:type I restriction enzyme S subunit
MARLYELPQSWKWTRLIEIAEIIMGQSPPSNTYNEQGEGLPFYQGKADFGARHPTPRKWCVRPQKIALPNDILLSVRAPVGPVNICPKTSCIGRGLAAIRPQQEVDYLFLFFYLRSIENYLAELGKGSTFGAIKKSDLMELRIPLPPFEEQKRIVARIEELVRRIEEAKRLHHESLRQAQSLLPSALHEVFSVLNKNWPTVKLGDICEKIVGGGTPSRNIGRYFKGDIPWATVKDINSIYLEDTQEHITREALEKSSAKLIPAGNIIVATRVGIGKVVINRIDVAINQDLKGLLLDQSEANTKYVLYFLMSFNLEKLSRETTVKGILKKKLVLIEIPLPPLDEQRRIVEYLDSIQSKAESLKRLQEETQKELNALLPSILDRAFRGEL